MAEQYPILEEAARTAAALSTDDRIRQLFNAREDYYRRYGWMEKANQRMASEIQQLTSENQQQASEIQQQASEIQQQASENRKLASENQRLRMLLAEAGIRDAENS